MTVTFDLIAVSDLVLVLNEDTDKQQDCLTLDVPVSEAVTCAEAGITPKRRINWDAPPSFLEVSGAHIAEANGRYALSASGAHLGLIWNHEVSSDFQIKFSLYSSFWMLDRVRQAAPYCARGYNSPTSPVNEFSSVRLFSKGEQWSHYQTAGGNDASQWDVLFFSPPIVLAVPGERLAVRP